ncbi:hypothetical protein D3C86_1380070 [compost metagenome]
MSDLDVYLSKIMPSVPGCPEPTAEHAIILAAQRFCESTRLWRDKDTFSILAEDSANTVYAPAGADFFEIESARFDNRDLEPISLKDLDYRHPGWREWSSGARFITQIDHGTVMVVPASAGTLELSTTLRPTEGATQLPDFLAKYYRQAIADGALAEILMLPGQSFTDPSRAMFFSQRFQLELDKLGSKSIKGQQRAKARVRPQFF